MIIKVNESTSYEFVSAKRENGQIVGTLADGSEIILGGDIPGIDDLIPQEPSTEAILLELAADHEERLCMMELGI